MGADRERAPGDGRGDSDDGERGRVPRLGEPGALLRAVRRAARGEGGFELRAQASERVAATPAVPSAPGALAQAAGHLVFWPVRNTARSVSSLLRALAAGVVPVLMPPQTPTGRRAALREAYPGFGWLEAGAVHLPKAPAPADPRLFLVLLTSGSTGIPKLVAATEPALAAGLSAIHEAQRLDDVASTGLLLPAFYSYALVNQLLWAAQLERALTLTPGLALPRDVFRVLRAHRVEMLCLVAAQLRGLRLRGLGSEDALPDVRVVSFAGAPFPVDALGFAQELFPNARFLNNYGCTEALPRLTACPVAGPDHPVSRVGRAIPGVELRIGAGDGEVGPIEFRAPSASIGTVRPDGGILEHEGWIPSGDDGRLEGGELHVYGRRDQVFKVGGERFSLLEVERCLAALPGVGRVYAWVDREVGAEPLALAAISGADQPAPAAIGAALRAMLPPKAWPARILWAASWPETPNGKTDRTGLRETAAADRLLELWRSPLTRLPGMS